MKLSSPLSLLYFILVQLSSIASAGAAPGPCTTIQLNNVYHCPTETIMADAEFLFFKVNYNDVTRHALYAGKLRHNVLSQSFLFDEPDGWAILNFSISPNRQIVLLTMSRKDCPANWPNPDGKSCSWGRSVLFSGFLIKNATSGDYYELVNLASKYGTNSTIAGWHTWLTTGKVLLNAKIVADTQYIGATQNQFAYIFTFDYDATKINGFAVSTWGSTKNINSQNCYVGRMHASIPPVGYSNSCSTRQYVTFARRCLNDSLTPDNFSWYNTVNYDGTGGTCRPPGGNVGASSLVPAFKNYVVQVDDQCNPISFDRNQPIRKPNSTGRYRHMGYRSEWGEGQPTINANGSAVAYWVKKSSDLASNINNCAGFESKDNVIIGNGAARVRVCYLDSSRQKCASVVNLPQPADPWNTQENAYFYRMDNGDLSVFTSETTGFYLSDLVTGQRRNILSGFGGGGYPISPK